MIAVSASERVARTYALSATEVIMSYYTLLEHSNQMLASVRNEDWDSLIKAELQYVEEVERLSVAEAEVELSDQQKLDKLQLLSTIMDQDREIRERLVARRTMLEQTLRSMNKKQKLEHSYRN
ncbi:flagellar protein FliT [Idiomarina sp. FenBw--71]|uniref:Flagellar protein FliT n=4 Tax=Pseudidiomarina TaxID=2800384 RepID=A0A368UWG5_9GAMM|nr:flagellar protein FliT [Idiomarina sp. FeN1]NCU57040.1 flagellar protein FliT [Idiomarina sp. FenA--70]NCU59749.1 flagellar protein FliT [Idiomarina sp. FenBw--71]PWW13754.1 flagellar protein FliT [Pseudidiomarina maritima]RBP91148.1 flagellar protein FliT [Pseudidiomarina tainanensis]